MNDEHEPRLTAGPVFFDGLLEAMKRFIAEHWRPAPVHREIGLTAQLADFIRSHTGAVRVKHQYRHAGQTVDVYVEWPGVFSPSRLYIEAKRNLLTKSQCDRLIGQIQDFGPNSSQSLLVVLVGETAPDLYERLVQYCARQGLNAAEVVRVQVAREARH